MSTTENEIKIIAGKYKGKTLPVLNADGLRPTPSRVREKIFSWLSNQVEGAKVLDLFAGTGALGFEAFSRGASEVTLVDLNRDNCNSIKKIAKSFDSENIHVFNSDAIKFLEDSTQKFDLIFIDPPYKLDIYQNVLSLILERNLIKDSSIIYVEMRNGSNQAVPGYEIIQEEHVGLSKFALWRKSQLLF